jgi:hypothetical protein
MAGIVGLPRFALPRDVEGFERIAKLMVSTTSGLYAQLYRGGAPLIGGRVFTRAIGWPS